MPLLLLKAACSWSCRSFHSSQVCPSLTPKSPGAAGWQSSPDGLLGQLVQCALQTCADACQQPGLAAACSRSCTDSSRSPKPAVCEPAQHKQHSRVRGLSCPSCAAGHLAAGLCRHRHPHRGQLHPSRILLLPLPGPPAHLLPGRHCCAWCACWTLSLSLSLSLSLPLSLPPFQHGANWFHGAVGLCVSELQPHARFYIMACTRPQQRSRPPSHCCL